MSNLLLRFCYVLTLSEGVKQCCNSVMVYSRDGWALRTDWVQPTSQLCSNFWPHGGGCSKRPYLTLWSHNVCVCESVCVCMCDCAHTSIVIPETVVSKRLTNTLDISIAAGSAAFMFTAWVRDSGSVYYLATFLCSWAHFVEGFHINTRPGREFNAFRIQGARETHAVHNRILLSLLSRESTMLLCS